MYSLTEIEMSQESQQNADHFGASSTWLGRHKESLWYKVRGNSF